MIRRALLCFLVILVGLALLAACNAARVDAPASDALTAAPALALPARVAQVEHGLIVEVRIRYEDGYEQTISAAGGSPTATPSPTATATARPTAAPTLTLIPTNTPPTVTPIFTPTRTPWPTFTPTPTFEASPTQEPTYAVTPTPAATTPPQSCELRADRVVNVRSGHGLNFPIVTQWAAGQNRLFSEFYADPNYLWGRHPQGWSVIYSFGDMAWWIAATYDADPCRTLPGWPLNLYPPSDDRSLLGYHLLVGVTNTVLAHLKDVSVVKGLTGSYDMALAARQIDPSITVICRSLHTSRGMIDGPMSWQWTAPETYYRELIGYLPTNCDFYEMINEWDSAPNWAIRADFEIAMLTLFARDGKCALFGSFAPGNPPLEAWNELVRVMRWIDAHPCHPGRYHGLSWHMPGHMPPDVVLLPGSFINSVWVAERDQIIERHLNTLGYSLNTFRGPIYITEFG